MGDVDLQGGLRSLRQSLKQIKALLAWEQLKQDETRPGQTPSFQLNNSIDKDLRNEYSFFLFTTVEIYGVLNEPSVLNISEEKRGHFKEQLLRLENQLRSLDIPARFYPYTKPA